MSILLRALREDDGVPLRQILAKPEVARWWDYPEPGFPWHDEPEATRFAIEHDGRLVGMAQFHEELTPKYRHAAIDLFLDPSVHGRGIGTEVVTRIAGTLVRERGHHRVTIDPAVENRAAIRAYEKAGFRRVGVMRNYERDATGAGWHDGLLMELIAGELPVGPRRA